MHGHFLDNYSHLNSPLHRVPAAAKLATAVGAIVLLVTLRPSPLIFTFAAIVLLMLIALSGVPGLYIAKRMLFLEPFILGTAVLTLFQPHGPSRFLIVSTRSTLCLLIMVLLTNTTPFSELLAVFRKLRAPGLVLTTLALMYRYLYVLKDELVRMQNARKSRTFARDRSLAWETLASVAAVLFVRSSARADRIYAAMCARGWK